MTLIITREIYHYCYKLDHIENKFEYTPLLFLYCVGVLYVL